MCIESKRLKDDAINWRLLLAEGRMRTGFQQQSRSGQRLDQQRNLLEWTVVPSGCCERM
jgi:hypothetical protein